MNILYKVLCGSNLYGLAEEDSDKDYEGIYIPDIKNLLGIKALENAKHTKEKNEETTYYSIQQFGKLVYEANFKALEILFADNVSGYNIQTTTKIFKQYFINNRDVFISERALVPLI
jgi:predicted nucleotidyltransferase